MLDNFSNSSVPYGEQVSGVKIASIIVGIAVALPAFLIGSQIIHSLGLLDGSLAIVVAGIILFVIATPIMQMGSRSRFSTYLIVQYSFGATGAKIVNALLAITLFGWYAITVSLFAESLAHALDLLFGIFIPQPALIILGSIFMAGTSIIGFRAIESLSRYTVPLMLALLTYAAYVSLSKIGLHEAFVTRPETNVSRLDFGTSVSAIVGAFMVGVTISSDISRFARSNKDALLASILSYGSFSMLILVFAGIPTLYTGNSNLIENMYSMGLGLPALVILVLSAWTTNSSNLYSASLGASQLFPKRSDWVLTISIGAIGTFLAIVGVMEYFIDFLLILSITIPPIAGIFLTDFYLINQQILPKHGASNGKSINNYAFIAWISSIAIGALSMKQLFIFTSISSIDAFVCAVLIYYLLMKSVGANRFQEKVEPASVD